MAIIVRMSKKGTFTLPVELRRKYSLQNGDKLTLIDLEDGVFLLSTRQTQVDHLGDQIAEKMAEANLVLGEVLTAWDEERHQIYDMK